MTADDADAQRTVVSLHSPERRWRVALCGLATLGAVLQLVVPHRSALEDLAGVALAVVFVTLGWRSSLTRTTADSGFLTDHRAFRTRQIEWPQVLDLVVGRPGGLWGGYCIRAVLRDGGELDLLSTRAYSLLPSRVNYDEIHRMIWTLQEARSK
jgi:hypothetical protein